jgi:hypothetical protein
MTSIQHYNLATSFYRNKFKKGGVSIFVHESFKFSGIDLQHKYKEQEIEVCAVKIKLTNRIIVILAVYRAPAGDFVYFVKELELILHQLYNISNDLVICGDFNVNYLEDSKNRQLLDNPLATFNVHAIVRFPTRIMNGTASAIDNIMTDKATNYTICPISNGLSDHDEQLLTLNNFLTSKPGLNYQYSRTINKFTISQFQSQLSSENWEEIFDESDSNNVNLLFNKFLDTYLKIFQTCFQKRKVS